MDVDLAGAIAAVAAAVPEREAVVHGDRRRTYREFVDEANRFARVLHERGLGLHRERPELAGYESGQDHLALYLHNGIEFLEANVGAFAARVAPFNVNYRYVDDELVALFADQRARAVVFHSTFAPVVERIAARLPHLEHLFQVADGSGAALARGAVWYHEVIAGLPADPPPVRPSPDDLYVLCTGGTTGTPKGVLWRQADLFVAALGGMSTRTRAEFTSLAELAEEAELKGGKRNLATAPFMHGAAQWTALTTLTHGNTVIVTPGTGSFDPAAVWATVERERVTLVQVVGDSFVRPLLDALDDQDVDSLRIVNNGGAVLSVTAKQRILERLPGRLIVDGLGSSEAGPIGNHMTSDDATTTEFTLGPFGCVLAEGLDRVLDEGDPSVGWLTTRGRIPLGYLNDPERTARTFPVIDGVRYAVAGDRGRYRPDGTVELLGRDAVTINTGGEKVFAEEVEEALLAHPSVADVVVCGRPSERWGNEVVAVVSLRPGASADPDDLRRVAGRSLARYKLPKQIVFRDRVQRSPAGKADYAWARAQAEAADPAAAPAADPSDRRR
ncbi:MAG: AMP-binding protein [Acidimicrobiales bacterium]|jgi:fatty-acyl-CoA synthase|nr:AMP-binding protein [Acidimicrobiales bacterium]